MAASKKNSSWLSEWWRIFRILLLCYAVVLVGVSCSQRSLLYHPLKKPLPTPASVQLGAMETVTVKTADGLALTAWFAPPENEALPVIVVFHGNAGSIAHRGYIADVMLKQGYGVFLCEYRGFSANPGSPTEEGLYSDGRAALAWLKKHGYDADRIVLYGESLGTGVAVQMATEITPKYLVLQSPFSSAVDVAQEMYRFLPVQWLMKDKYDSYTKIEKVHAPLLIVHGNQDSLIPISLAEKLYEAANEPKTLVIIQGAGHNDLYELDAGTEITNWLGAHRKGKKNDE